MSLSIRRSRKVLTKPESTFNLLTRCWLKLDPIKMCTSQCPCSATRARSRSPGWWGWGTPWGPSSPWRGAATWWPTPSTSMAPYSPSPSSGHRRALTISWSLSIVSLKPTWGKCGHSQLTIADIMCCELTLRCNSLWHDLDNLRPKLVQDTKLLSNSYYYLVAQGYMRPAMA